MVLEYKGTSLAVGEELKSSPGKGQYLRSKCGMYCIVLGDDGNLCCFTGKDPEHDLHDIFNLSIATGYPRAKGNYVARMQDNGIFAIYKVDDYGQILSRLWASEEKPHMSSKDYVAHILDNGEFGISSDTSQITNNLWSMTQKIPGATDPVTIIEVYECKYDTSKLTIVGEIVPRIIYTSDPITNPYPDKPYHPNVHLEGKDTWRYYFGEWPFNYVTGDFGKNIKIPVIVSYDPKTKKPKFDIVSGVDGQFNFGYSQSIEKSFTLDFDGDIPVGKTYVYNLVVFHAEFSGTGACTLKAKVTFNSMKTMDITLDVYYHGENSWDPNYVPVDKSSYKIIKNIPLPN